MSAWLDVAGVAPDGRLPCQACGTWTCPDCGWQRPGANLDVFQDCPRCGGGSNEEQAFTRTRHYKRWVYEAHNPAAGPRCAGWYEYIRADPGLLCLHQSCRQITWNDSWEEWSSWTPT